MTRKMFFGAFLGILAAPFVKIEKPKDEVISLRFEVDDREALDKIKALQAQIDQINNHRDNPIYVSWKEFGEFKDRIAMKATII